MVSDVLEGCMLTASFGSGFWISRRVMVGSISLGLSTWSNWLGGRELRAATPDPPEQLLHVDETEQLLHVDEMAQCTAPTDLHAADGVVHGPERKLSNSAVNEGEVGQPQCIVCMDAPANCAIIPCGHLCLCGACSSKLLTRDACCPICRAPRQQVVRIYVSGADEPLLSS